VCAPFGVTAAGRQTLVDRLAVSAHTLIDSDSEGGRKRRHTATGTLARWVLTQPPRGRWRCVLRRVGSVGFSVGADRSCGGAACGCNGACTCSCVRAGFERGRCRMTAMNGAARCATGRGESGGVVEIFPPLVVCCAGAAGAAAHSAASAALSADAGACGWPGSRPKTSAQTPVSPVHAATHGHGSRSFAHVEWTICRHKPQFLDPISLIGDDIGALPRAPPALRWPTHPAPLGAVLLRARVSYEQAVSRPAAAFCPHGNQIEPPEPALVFHPPGNELE
jgi:hypothetical protein